MTRSEIIEDVLSKGYEIRTFACKHAIYKCGSGYDQPPIAVKKKTGEYEKDYRILYRRFLKALEPSPT